MPRPCVVCTHPDREAMDRLLVDGRPAAAIAAQYRVSDDSVTRHRQRHLPAVLVAGKQASEQSRGERLLGRLEGVVDRSERLLATAEGRGDLKAAAGLLKELRAGLETLARLEGLFPQTAAPGPAITLVLNQQVLQVRAVIVEALAAYPEAREAVCVALAGLEGGDG